MENQDNNKRDVNTGSDKLSKNLQEFWSNYIGYSAACLRADTISGLVPAYSKYWSCIRNTVEEVVTQGDRILEVDGEIDRLAERLMPGQSMQYGWPLVALENREGLLVAPLFVVNIATPPYEDGYIEVFGDPVLNPSVIKSLLSVSGDVEFLRSHLGDGLPQGPVAIARYVEDIAHILGLPYQELDPSNLNIGMPEEVGIYNSAAVVIVDNIPEIKPSLEDMEELARRTDWEGTVAFSLLESKNESLSRDSMPIMPWSTDEAFEQGLQLVRNKKITVFNMSQRDVIDQLCASIACNAWNDGESLLIVSDDQKRLNELAKLAHDIHDGMLVRACCDRDFSDNPRRVGRPLAELSVELIDNTRATLPALPTVLQRVEKEIKTASEFRRVAIEGSHRRDELIKEKHDAENKRLELAKRIWRNGSVPGNVDATDLGQEIKNLKRTWFCAGVRSAALMMRIKAKKGVTIDDVFEWCLTVLSIRHMEEELNSLRDPDKYNLGAANYRWASTGNGVVSARVSECLSVRIPLLERLAYTQERDEQTRDIITEAIPALRCWSCDYYSVSTYFQLKSNMFDILILDGAHRHSLAKILPLLYRARRVVVIGDLIASPYISFLEEKQINEFAEDYHIDRTKLAKSLDSATSNAYLAFVDL